MDLQFVRGVAVDPRRQPADPVAWPVDDQGGQDSRRPVAEHGDGAAGRSIGIEVEAVESVSGKSHVQIAGLHRSGIVAYAGNCAVAPIRGSGTPNITEVFGNVADLDPTVGTAAIVRVEAHRSEYPVREKTMSRS
jgi:hypothetical protein